MREFPPKYTPVIKYEDRVPKTTKELILDMGARLWIVEDELQQIKELISDQLTTSNLEAAHAKIKDLEAENEKLRLYNIAGLEVMNAELQEQNRILIEGLKKTKSYIFELVYRVKAPDQYMLNEIEETLKKVGAE